MKKFCVIPMLAALAIFASCQKQQTEEERKAEVERQVQDRLAAERSDAEKKRLEEERAALEAREKAIAEREAAAAVPAEQPTVAPVEREVREPVETTETRETRTEERSTASYGMFYEKLDPYGEWRETNDYGYVWQPREAESSRDWRPYTEGRWAYSDAGWTWISDEKFGWATYHYGRWVKLRRIGWVWVPGDEWAPAWVSWRTSKDYVGWAPLPPEARFDRRSGIHNWADSYYDIGPEQYAFVSSNDFGAEHVRRSVVPAERNITIVIETSNVTRITFANTTIMNEGPNYEELRSRGPRQIERYRLRRQRNAEMQARVNGAELEVSVPLLSETRNVFRPRRVRERVTEVNVDNGWTEIKDRSAAERARTKVRAEATPPPNAPPRKFVKPVEQPTASATPATTTASATPATTTAPAASPTPGATASPAATTAAASPTPAASSTVVPNATPSPTPRVRPSASIRPRPSPTVAAAPAATSPAVAASPATTPIVSPSIAAETTPAASIAPSPRVRPSPSIPPRTIPTPSPVLRQTPPAVPGITPAATMTPVTTPAVRPSISVPPVRRPSPTPAPPADTTTSDAAKPPAVPAITPAVRPSISVPPVRRPSPTPVPPADATDAAKPPVPRNLPRQTVPPRLTPPAVTTPVPTPAENMTPAPSVPAVPPERQNNNRRRPLPPVPGATPTPSPSAPPQ